MIKKVFTLILFCCILTSAYAGNRVIQGIVRSSDDKDPLIGATISIPQEGKSPMGVATDIDGKFTVTIPDNAKEFVCSYMGFNTKKVMLVAGQEYYDVLLEPTAQMLEGVIVTGYQTIERRKLTAAVSTLNISDETVGAVTSIDQALAGQIAGLSATSISGSPTAPMKIRIRGTASLNGTQDPLWVLDGIPLEGTEIPKLENDNDITNIQQSSIAGLSPSDIENITVLKDVAATAIYGARAANGVIVITTKKGKKGKPRVNFSSKFTYSPTLGNKKLNLLNAAEKVQLELDLMKSGYSLHDNKGDVSRILNVHGLVNDFQQHGWSGLTTQAQSEIDALRGNNHDWSKELFRGAFNQEYNVNISGGGDNVTYYNSLGYFSQDGNVKNVNSDRFNLVSKTFYQMSKKFKVGVSIFANRRTNRTYMTDKYGYNNPLYYSRIANPYQDLYDANGDYIYDYNIQKDENKNLGFNIAEENENTLNKEKITSLSSILDLEFRVNDQLKFTSQLGIQLDQVSKEQIADQETYTMRDLRERSQYWDSASGGYKYFIPDGGVHKSNENNNSQFTWKAMGEYRNTFSDIHEFEVMLGTEIRKTWAKTQFSAGYGFDRRTLETKPVIFPDKSYATNFPLHLRTKQTNAYASFFATTSYSLMKKYVLGGSIRFDGSDLFGVDKKYRYLPLYSVSGMWRASQESFLNEESWLDNLALRASYGIQGNIDKNTSPLLLGTYKDVNILPGASEHIIEINNAPNAKLRWEKTYSVNAGVDFSILNQGINLSVDYYYRKGVDLIGTQMLPLQTGFTSTSINWASMVNKGIEVSLNTRNITTKHFSWYTIFNFAYNNNKVLKEKVSEQSILPSREGYPAGAIFVLKTAGLNENGYPVLLNKKGEKVQLEELYRLEDPWGIGFASSNVEAKEERGFYSYAGTNDTPYTGGLINTFSYKNWELSFNLAYNFGGHVRTQPSYLAYDFNRGQNTNKDILDRWTPENPNGKFPTLMGADRNPLDYAWYKDRTDIYRSLDIWVKKLNYVRLQNLRLGYRLPKSITNKLGMNSASVAAEGRNLFVFGSNYKNYMDPESMGNLYSAPVPKSFIFSLNLNF